MITVSNNIISGRRILWDYHSITAAPLNHLFKVRASKCFFRKVHVILFDQLRFILLWK